MLLFLFTALLGALTCACGAPVTNLEVADFEAKAADPAVFLVDVRTPEEYAEGHLRGAANIDWNAPDFLAQVQAACPKEAPAAVYCRTGRRSGEASKKLSQAGYAVCNLVGGIEGEITEDGKVKFNGKEIDQITVGGRTFFFNDQATALNNLPASVVDKIRVIERESEQTRDSGIKDGDKERVLDVGLKKEYEKGWFGNLGVKAGTTLGEKAEENPLRDDRGFLWGGNALVSAYTEKDQVTVIANAQNIDDSGMVFAGMDDSR